MSDHRILWRKDFRTVPAVERRIARYALQRFQGDTRLHPHLHDRDFLGALWQLTLPLLNPPALATFLPRSADEEPAWLKGNDGDEETARMERKLRRALNGEDSDDDEDDAEQQLVAQAGSLRKRVRTFLKTIPRWVMQRLAEADGQAPTSTTPALLGEALGLDATAVRILDYLELREQSEPLRVLLRAGGRSGERVTARINLEQLATMLGLGSGAVRAALDKQSPLSTSIKKFKQMKTRFYILNRSH